ncbi:9 TM domain-containing transmembrane protein [Acrasis kona]|uniref:9 TM domain-containing transmembrane protein n=1 Tax=Acrasis kona TaxID=1008807 RepID=A0AAW2Z960_9EUKA
MTSKQLLESSRYLLKEVWKMSFIILPVIIIHMGFDGMDLVNEVFLGSLSLESMTAGVLAQALCACLIAVPLGMSGAQETLVSQAYGVENRRLMRAVLLRSIIITLFLFFPIIIVCCLSKFIFQVIQHDMNVANMASKYVWVMIPGLFPFVICKILSSYMISQDRLLIPCLVSITNIVMTVTLNLLFSSVGHDAIGYLGTATSSSITRVFSLLMLCCSLLLVNAGPDQHGDSFIQQCKGTIKEAFDLKGIKEHIKLAIPSAVVVCVDHWSLESLTYILTEFGEEYVSAHSVVVSITLIAYGIPDGVATATTSNIGCAIGSKQPKRAKWLCWISIVISFVLTLASAGLIFGLREPIICIMVQNKNVEYIIERVMPVVFVYQIQDGVQLVLNGILLGLGKQFWSSIIIVIGYCIVGLPIGSVLAFTLDLKILGYWIGLCLGLFAICHVIVLYLMAHVDWDWECDKAQKRIAELDHVNSIKSTLPPLKTEKSVP